MPEAARASGIVMTGAMLGFPGEDYTTPQTIKKTGGFGDPADRPERLERLRWALDRTVALGLSRPDAPRRLPPRAGRPRPHGVPRHPGAGRPSSPQEKGITLAFETGQETADLLRRTLDDLKCAEPEGQLRPGQHAPLRHGRPDPRRRDPRPRHPQRPRQGRQPPDDPRPVGRGSAAGPGRGRTSGGSCRPSRTSATPARSSSSARSATRPPGSATSPTAWPICANAWPAEAGAGRDAQARRAASLRRAEGGGPRCMSSIGPTARRRAQATTEMTTSASSRPASVRP